MSEKKPRLKIRSYTPSVVHGQRLSLKWIFGSGITIKLFGIKLFGKSKKSRQ